MKSLDQIEQLNGQQKVPNGQAKTEVMMKIGGEATSDHSQIFFRDFDIKMEGSDKAVVFEIIKALDKICSQYQLNYFLYGGTLLGSYRHHDIIPWDDDVDVLMNVTERDVIFSSLSFLSPRFKVVEAGDRLKFYSEKSRQTSYRFPWKWPYVDINFFTENETHISDSASEFRDYVYTKETIFPLHRRPLGGLSLYAPRDTFAYLTATYKNASKCLSNKYSHREERRIGGKKSFMVSCERFKDRYPFVHRTEDLEKKGILETLRIGNTDLYSVVIEEPTYAITEPFQLQLIQSSFDP